MLATDVLDTLNSVLALGLRNEWNKALPVLRGKVDVLPPRHLGALVRTALRNPNITMTQCMALDGIWTDAGRPDLKPNVVRRRVRIISDATTDNIASLTRLFGATYGLDLEIAFSPFDSVEQEIMNPASDTYSERWDIVVLMLSEHWLKRYLGTGPMVSETDLGSVCELTGRLARTLTSTSQAKLIVTTVAGRAFLPPAAWIRAGDRLGWNLAIAILNQELAKLADPSVVVIDLGASIAAAGGASALGRSSHVRARMAFEPKGTVAVAWTLADAIAGISGKLHRAVVVDWDNTLWGGEVAEMGPTGVIVGPDSAEGLGYVLVQEYLKGLRDVGVVLAGISRNQPTVIEVLDRHPGLVLHREDFTSLRIGFGRKSEYLGLVSDDLGFGTEFMVYLDDSIFELVEILCEHPFADIILAGPDPLDTMERLSAARLGNLPVLTDDDLVRAARMDGLRQQREQASVHGSLDEFLKSIDMRLAVRPLDEENAARVEQMFQKTNQFNLTTRRHQMGQLRAIVQSGGQVLAFDYEDRFGAQGIIGVLVLVPHDSGATLVESLLMSCRVLNRRVEHAMLECAFKRVGGSALIGEFLPTEKNAIVMDLYKDFGFQPLAGENGDGRFWILDRSHSPGGEFNHFAKLTIEEL